MKKLLLSAAALAVALAACGKQESKPAPAAVTAPAAPATAPAAPSAAPAAAAPAAPAASAEPKKDEAPKTEEKKAEVQK